MGRGTMASERHGERKGHRQRHEREREKMMIGEREREREREELKDKRERKQTVKRIKYIVLVHNCATCHHTFRMAL